SSKNSPGSLEIAVDRGTPGRVARTKAETHPNTIPDRAHAVHRQLLQLWRQGDVVDYGHSLFKRFTPGCPEARLSVLRFQLGLRGGTTARGRPAGPYRIETSLWNKHGLLVPVRDPGRLCRIFAGERGLCCDLRTALDLGIGSSARVSWKWAHRSELVSHI